MRLKRETDTEKKVVQKEGELEERTDRQEMRKRGSERMRE